MPLSRRPRAGVLPALAEYVKVDPFQVALFHVHLEGSLRSTLQRRRASLNGRACANAPSVDVRGYHETALTTGLAPFSAAQRLFGHGPQVEYATTAGCQLHAREATAGPQQRRHGLGALGMGLKALSDTVHDKKVFHDQSEEHNLPPRFDPGTNETSMALFRGVQGRAVPRWLDVPIHYGLAACLSNGTTTESGSFSCSRGGLGTRQAPKLLPDGAPRTRSCGRTSGSPYCAARCLSSVKQTGPYYTVSPGDEDTSGWGRPPIGSGQSADDGCRPPSQRAQPADQSRRPGQSPVDPFVLTQNAVGGTTMASSNSTSSVE